MNKVASHWDKIAQDYTWSDFEEDVVLPALLSFIGEIKGKSVLEMGCGDGKISLELASTGAKVTGIDTSQEMIAKAKHKIKSELKKRNILENDLSDLGTFDLVLLPMVAHHLTKDELNIAFRNVHSLLNKKGVFVLLDPHPCFESNVKTASRERYSLEPNPSYFENHKIRITLKNTKRQKTSIFDHNHKPLQDLMNAYGSNQLFISTFKEIKVPLHLKKTYPKEARRASFLLIKAQKK